MLEYEHYKTPAEFDAGYANSIDDIVVARWEKFFREASQKLSSLKREELVYGPNDRNRIDFFAAPDAGPGSSTLFAIHGGLWFLFDKWMMHFLVPAFTGAGINVVCPNYRLAPEASLDEIVADCRSAMAFLYRNRISADGIPGPISLLGHSAAGQLVAVLASTDWPAFDRSLPVDLIHAWVGVSGFYDIEPFGQTGFHVQTDFDMDAYRRWNPINLVRAGMPPGLLIAGSKESGLIHEMMEGYALRLQKSGAAVKALDAAGESHFSVLSRIGDPQSELYELVVSTIR